MIEHSFSKHFKPNTDIEYKNAEFERSLGIFMEGLVEFYPNLITKEIIEGVEVWSFKFLINNNHGQ